MKKSKIKRKKIYCRCRKQMLFRWTCRRYEGIRYCTNCGKPNYDDKYGR
jgi:hypothetical protein